MRRFVLLLIVAILATCTSQPAFAQGDGAPAPTPNDRAVVAEADFIARMVAEAKPDGKGGDPGPKGGAPKGEQPKKKDEEEGAEPEGNGEGSGDGDEGGEEEGAAARDDDEEGAGDEEGAEGADGEDEAAGDGSDGADGGDGDEIEGEAEDDDEGQPASDELADLDPEDEAPVKLEAALRRHGAKAVVEKLPPALRAIVKKRLAEMEAPFTRAMKEATAFRPQQAELLAERKFRQDNPVDYVLDMLLADPSLGEKVNERLDEISGSTTTREAHDVVVQDKKRKALEAVTKETTQAEARIQRGQQIEAYVERRMTALGIPAELGVEEAVALHITEHGDITREEVDRILGAKAKQAERLFRGRKRGDRRTYIDAKVKDRKTAGLKVKPGSGAAPAPGKGKTAKNDGEFLEQMDRELAARGF